MIKPVPTVEPDYTRCRAAVADTVADTWRQCSRHPWASRQDRDGQLYPVCRQHRRAKRFMPWSARFLMTDEEVLEEIQRDMEADPPKPKLVR